MTYSEILAALEAELFDLTPHGIVRLEIHVRDNRIARYALSRERSFAASTEAEGVGLGPKQAKIQAKRPQERPNSPHSERNDEQRGR